MKNRNVKFFFQDILESILKIRTYAGDLNYEDFISNSMVIDAITRNFEVIGEAARHIDTSFKDKYPELPLKEMIGMRNVLIHDYLGIDYMFLWQTTKEDLPALEKLISKILNEI
jgi:uncharacterized protein with HEPN domain